MFAIVANPRVRWAVILAAVIVIAGLGLMPSTPATVFLSGSAMHILGFAGLATVALLCWPGIDVLLLWTGISLFGGSIELLQAAMHVGREAEWADVACNCASAAATILLLRAGGAFLRGRWLSA